MNDDIETIRTDLEAAIWQSEQDGVYPNQPGILRGSLAALDRLEAENERLREEILEARESRDQHLAGRQHNAREVERLRALYNIGTFLAADDDNEETLLRKALAEVERMRLAHKKLMRG